MKTCSLLLLSALSLAWLATACDKRIELTVTDEVINSNYLGNGVEWDPYDEAASWGCPLSESEWDTLYARLDYMQPQYVRCMINSPFTYFTGKGFEDGRNAENLLKLQVLYGPGEDGAYWDYMYVGKKAGVAVNIDCSQWYGWLPHTETTYTFNPEDITDQSPCGTVTIKISNLVTYNVPILLPGSYEFLGKSALVVADGCMALALPLADAPSKDHSYEWTDYDRFVNSPLLYVMVFEKQVPSE